MGCAQTRDKNEAQVLQVYEKKLLFPNFTITQIQKAFSDRQDVGVICRKEVDQALFKIAKFKYDSERETMELYQSFLDTFHSFEEDDLDYYELNEIQSILFILSKSSPREKANALFDLYNLDQNEQLSRIEIENALYRLIEAIFAYTQKLLNTPDSIIQLHKQVTNSQKDNILPKFLDFLFLIQGDNVNSVTKAQFIERVMKASQSKSLFNLTCIHSIRKKFMDYLFHPKKNHYLRKESRTIQTLFRQTEADLEQPKTNDNSSHNDSFELTKIIF